MTSIMKAMPGMFVFAKKPTMEKIWLNAGSYSIGGMHASVTSRPISGTSSVGSRSDINFLDDVYTIENAKTPLRAAEIQARIEALAALFGEKAPQEIINATPVRHGDYYSTLIENRVHRVFRISMWPDDYKLPQCPITLEQAEKLHKDCFWLS